MLSRLRTRTESGDTLLEISLEVDRQSISQHPLGAGLCHHPVRMSALFVRLWVSDDMPTEFHICDSCGSLQSWLCQERKGDLFFVPGSSWTLAGSYLPLRFYCRSTPNLAVCDFQNLSFSLLWITCILFVRLQPATSLPLQFLKN